MRIKHSTYGETHGFVLSVEDGIIGVYLTDQDRRALAEMGDDDA